MERGGWSEWMEGMTRDRRCREMSERMLAEEKER
jgi:hypothetical protein